MKKQFLTLLLSILCVYSYAQETGTPSTLLTNTSELATYAGNAKMIVVTNDATGGTFYYSKEKKTVDNGIVFPAAHDGYWVRVYNKTDGVDVAWFGAKMDGETSDDAMLKNALKYNDVKISDNLALSSNLNIPAGKTITFTGDGAFTIADGAVVTFDAFIKANDYQYIFKGSGKVILGTESAPYASACWFGAVADCRGLAQGGGKDNTNAIQNAIIAAQNVSDLYLPPSPANCSYRITSTLRIGKDLHFSSFNFHGGGTTITANKGDKATTIFADFKSGAAINIQSSRRSYISDMILYGCNKASSEIWGKKELGTAVVDDPASFTTPGVQSDYAAIITDGEQDNKVWSADIVFERLLIQGFYLGIGISQAGHLQGDRMRVDGTQINSCVYGVSIGNAQARACQFMNLDMNHIWCAFTNNTFGNHTGSEFQITGGQWCNVYKLFHIQPYNTGQCVVSGLYTEAIGQIGEIGDGSANNSSFLFTGCNFMLQDGGMMKGGRMYSKFYTLTSFGNINFTSCNFWTAKPYIAMMAGYLNGFNASNITLTGCSFLKPTHLHLWGNTTVENSYLLPNSTSIDYNRTVHGATDGTAKYNTSYNATNLVSMLDGEYEQSRKAPFSKNIVRTIPRFYVIADGKENISGIQMHGDTVRFTYSEALGKKLFRYVLPGDVLGTTIKGTQTSWDNPTLKILNVDAGNRTVDAVMYTDLLTFDKLALYTNCFITPVTISGVLTQGSAMINHINYPQLLNVGDFITFAQSTKAYRIKSQNTNDSTVELMDAVTENVHGPVVFYNQQLTDGLGNQSTEKTTTEPSKN